VTWLVPRKGVLALGRPPREVPGTVVDASLTGAAILGPSTLPFEASSQVRIRYEGHESSVSVRRREHTDDPGVHLYGVELMVVHPSLKEHISAHVVEARRRDDAGPESPPTGIVL